MGKQSEAHIIGLYLFSTFSWSAKGSVSWFWESNSGQPSARKALYPLYSFFSPQYGLSFNDHSGCWGYTGTEEAITGIRTTVHSTLNISNSDHTVQNEPALLKDETSTPEF